MKQTHEVSAETQLEDLKQMIENGDGGVQRITMESTENQAETQNGGI